mgnify:CR=1 FL=1
MRKSLPCAIHPNSLTASRSSPAISSAACSSRERRDLDARFHLALAECTGNKLLIDTVARLNRIYAKGRTPELRDTPWRQFSVSSTCASSTRLSGGPREDSRKALEEHIDTVIHKHLFATVRD